MKPSSQIRLLAGNRGRGQFRAEATGADEVTLYVYDVIVGSDIEAEWWGGVSPEAFAKTIAGISAKTIHLRINSPGGDAFAARAMETVLREHPARVVAHIDGLAASAATVLMLGADEIVAAEGAMVMIHKAWILAVGNANDMLDVAALLEKIDGTLAVSYAARGARTADEFAELMADETWFTAQEAKDVGLVDSVISEQGKAKARAPQPAQALFGWDVSAFAHAPAVAASAAPGAPAKQQTTARALPPQEVAAMKRRLDVAACEDV